jgi:dihydromonapterin reductase / dihydrofolate reductase
MKAIKHAVITGAGRRFGHTLAKSLIEEGYRVIAHYNTSKDGVKELEALGAIGVQADLSNPDEVLGLVKAIQNITSTVDLLVNNASCFFNNTKVDQSLDNLTAVLNVHVAAPYLLIQGLTPQLTAAKPSLVVNITDIYTDSPAPEHLAYCAAKAALANLTQGFAKTLAPHIRVNAIQPGPILFLPEHNQPHRQKILAETPLNIEGGLEPMLQAVRFLRDNPYITGESIKVDGGRALNL